MTRRGRYDGIDYGYTGPVGPREHLDNMVMNIASTITDAENRADRLELDALYAEIVAAGVHPLKDWPWPVTTSAGLTNDLHHEADYQRIAEMHGTHRADQWRLLRERELWNADPRNPRAMRTAPGAPPSDESVTVERVRAKAVELREATNERPTQQAVAEALGVSVRRVSTVCSPHGGYVTVVPLDRK